MRIAEQYVNEYGTREVAALAFAQDLMRGDPPSFKVGYTAPNAVLATVESFDLSPAERARLERALQATV